MACGAAAKFYGTPCEDYVATCPHPESWKLEPMQIPIAAMVRTELRDLTPHEIRESNAKNPLIPVPEGVFLSEKFDIPRIPLDKFPDELWTGAGVKREATMPLKGEWICRGAGEKDIKRDGPLLIFFHGGGYIIGSATGFRSYPFTMAAQEGIPTLNIDYALAPEDPFPLAVTDAMSVVKYVADMGFDPSKVVCTGDSAGGGLSYAVSLAFRDFGAKVGLKGPGGIAGLTPYVDMTLTAPSLLLGSFLPSSPFSLCLLTHKACRASVISYAASNFPLPASLLASSYFRPLVDGKAGLPPQLILTGGYDTLLDEDILLALRRTRLGEQVKLEIWEEQPHDPWTLFGPPVVMRKSFESIAEFVRAVAEGKPTKTGMASFDPITGVETAMSEEDAVKRLKKNADEARANGLFAEIQGAEEAAEMYSKGI